MALKLSQLLSFIFLLLLVFSATGHAQRNILPRSDNKSSPFGFIKQLKGCHKGDNTKGIHQLKTYLEEFGYLEYLNRTHADDDDFDDSLESAVRTYQENYHIKSTGTLDATTISKMTTPRCGVPDIINRINYMQLHKQKHDCSSKFHTSSHYNFFPKKPRWPSSKTHLTYKFMRNTPTFAVGPVARAFKKWAHATHFTFSPAQKNQKADLIISFFRGRHGDGAPFDGPGGILAHAYAPTVGRLHYDADERWSVGPVVGYVDVETVALHEIGHLLGLDHSSVEGAIMYPSIKPGVIKNLHADDIEGIKALYKV